MIPLTSLGIKFLSSIDVFVLRVLYWLGSVRKFVFHTLFFNLVFLVAACLVFLFLSFLNCQGLRNFDN